MVNNKKLLKYAEGKFFHRSLRISDVDRVIDIIDTLYYGKELNEEQYKFITDLRNEDKVRNKRYRENAKKKRLIGSD